VVADLGGIVIRVGIAGWDYPDWEGIVYPRPRRPGFDRLAFLAGFFDLLEINVSFYRQPGAPAARAWASRVASMGSFRFTAKLFRGLTHPRSLEVPDFRIEAERYRMGVEPLLEAGLLGAVLMQFPHSFRDNPANRRSLEALVSLLPGLPLVAEFRHRSWDNRKSLDLLRGLGVGFCNVDQPVIGQTLPPTCHATSRIAYIRLHGRNAAGWFRRGSPPSARYDYLYTQDELAPWIDRARALAESAEEVFIVANNHYRGKGPANALMIASALRRRRVKAPADLIASYPELTDMIAVEAEGPAQRRLF